MVNIYRNNESGSSHNRHSANLDVEFLKFKIYFHTLKLETGENYERQRRTLPRYAWR